MSEPHTVSEPLDPLEMYRRLQMAEGQLVEARQMITDSCRDHMDTIRERDVALTNVKELREALRECAQQMDEFEEPCWCQLPVMIPYRGHDSGCEMARAILEKTK
jgi:hypothetical protein